MTASTQRLASCSACGIASPLGARFCPGCGVPLTASSRAVTTAQRDAEAAADPLIGQVIAERYRILSLLGRGGMGVVYRVEHVHIGKLMAIKLLAGALASDASVLARFEREAKAVSQLTHPNTVQIFDFGESERLAYLVMEYLPGRDLATLIAEEGALPFDRVARIGAQIAGSVEEAHQRGIIHRDVKPENIMVLDTSEQTDFVKVLDFGIAKLRDVAPGSLATQKGHLIGTPYYMAPEQIRGEAFDHRVDVYALGALMYKALTGVTPFVGDTPMEVLGQHLNEALVPPSTRARELEIPRAADRILARALAKHPSQRYPTMAALREDLLGYLQASGIEAASPRARPRSAELATRIDVDRYERRLGRTLRIGAAALVPVLMLAGYASYRLWPAALHGASARSAEREPNDDPAQANLLGAGKPLAAQLGKRRSIQQGDADVYRFELAAESVVDLTVSALPNIDLLIELVARGSSRPLLVVDGGKVGMAERIPNITLSAGAYFVRVREPVARGAYPMENVSDYYTVGLALAPPTPMGEHEINDGYESSEKLVPGTSREGLIGWPGDRDVYCAALDREARTITLHGVPGLDLVLAFLDRNTEAGQRIDRAGVGEAEQLELPPVQSPRRACFTVSAREREGADRASSVARYRLVLR